MEYTRKSRRPCGAVPAIGLALCLSAFATRDAHAEPYFLADQVLKPGHELDLLVWRMDAGPDSAWDCADSVSRPFATQSCLVKRYARSHAALDNYLYWAFLNAGRRTKRGSLAARDADDYAAFTGRRIPLLALKQREDTCQYLVLFRNELAPLAGGRVDCPDLRSALREIAADLEGKDHLIPPPADEDPKVIRRPGVISRERPRSLDFGIDAAAEFPIPLSADKDPDPQQPYSSGTEAFDFDDYAEMKGLPYSLRATLLFRDVAGLRLGFTRTSYSMQGDLLNGLAQSAAASGAVLTAWDIERRDWSLELILGGVLSDAIAEYPYYGFIGFGKSAFDETATVDGRRLSDQHLLKDENTFLFGAGIQTRFPWFLIGFEAQLLIKDFRLDVGEGSQPDGSGSEVRLRVFAGTYYRHSWKPKAGGR